MSRFRAVAAAVLFAWPAHATEPTIEELLDATDDVARGTSSIAEIRMEVKTARYERTLRMKAWSQGTERTLIRILEPEKDRGIATLKVGENIWNYLPKVDRTMKVPAGMMSGSWMGSHITNDDLVKESRLSEDYTWTLVSSPDAAGAGAWVIDLVPRPEAPVVWGKVTVTVTADRMPQEVAYFEEDGSLVRTLRFSDYRESGGRRYPAVMSVIPADAPGEYTTITYESLVFDPEIPDDTFSTQALRR